MTIENYLATLQPAIQAELVSLVRAAAGMSREEKVVALAALDRVATASLLALNPELLAAVPLLSAVGQVIAQVDHAGFPREHQKEA